MYDIPEAKLEVSLEALREQSVAISTEAVTGDQLIRAFTGRLNKFAKTLKEYTKGLFSNAKQIKGDWNILNLRLLLNKHPYSETSFVKVAKPRGLVGTYKDLYDQLDAAMTLVEQYPQATQEPFKAWLGKVVGSPDNLKSMRDLQSESGAALVSTIEQRRRLASQFSDSPGADAPLSTLARSNGELLDVYILMDAFVDRVNRLDIKKIVKNNEEINELLEILGNRVQEDGDTYRVSGVSLKFIAEAALNVAEQGELISIILFHTKALAEALWTTDGKLRQAY